MTVVVPAPLVEVFNASKPYLVFLLGLVIKSPLPEDCFRSMLSKGARFKMDTQLVNNFFSEVQVAAKVVVQNISGGTPDEKAQNAVNFLEPLFNEALTALNVSPFLQKVADGLFELVVKNEIKALAQ